MVSRSRAKEEWDEADRIEALTLQEGIVAALKRVGWIVDVDDSEADYGKTRWLLWLRHELDFIDIVEGTPLGFLGLLKPKFLELDDALSTREWLGRVCEERHCAPEPPVAGNILERLLEKVPQKKLIESLSISDFGDAEKKLAAWAMYCNMDHTGSAELRDNLRRKLLRSM
jgi:hypothetical protein